MRGPRATGPMLISGASPLGNTFTSRPPSSPKPLSETRVPDATRILTPPRIATAVSRASRPCGLSTDRGRLARRRRDRLFVRRKDAEAVGRRAESSRLGVRTRVGAPRTTEARARRISRHAALGLDEPVGESVRSSIVGPRRQPENEECREASGAEGVRPARPPSVPQWPPGRIFPRDAQGTPAALGRRPLGLPSVSTART